jgi:hypothetical protein
MTLHDEVRQALEPLIDQGLVYAVQAGPLPASRGASDLGHHEAVTVIVNADDPEAHRVDIMKLMLQAGLKAELSLQPNLARPRE